MNSKLQEIREIAADFFARYHKMGESKNYGTPGVGITEDEYESWRNKVEAFLSNIPLSQEHKLAWRDAQNLDRFLYRDFPVCDKPHKFEDVLVPYSRRLRACLSFIRKVEVDYHSEVGQIAESGKQDSLKQQAEKLRNHISNRLPPETKAFLEEAVGCLEHGYRRAAVVLSWQGALSILQSKVFSSKLAEFNTEAKNRSFLIKPIVSLEHFQKMREADQLLCFEAINLISKSVRSSLTECLNRRNNCGHPNDFKIGDGQVAGHLETLHDHVFANNV